MLQIFPFIGWKEVITGNTSAFTIYKLRGIVSYSVCKLSYAWVIYCCKRYNECAFNFALGSESDTYSVREAAVHEVVGALEIVVEFVLEP